MKRTAMEKLQKWKKSGRRKPLILKGARQVGKTWLLKEFGSQFSGGCVYINFDKDEEYAQMFSGTKDVNRILDNLSIASRVKIGSDTLIVLDEISACPDALNTLKYFCEDRPDLHVAAAGSLLGLD